MKRHWINEVHDDDMFILREAIGFYLDIVAAREADGDDRPGSTDCAISLAQDLGINVSHLDRATDSDVTIYGAGSQ